ncbi:TetR/AcrR family transcriptional regulator [Actinacidiphila sp. ITFR-21]|uniref:TetR/AcrR family transcriptional regulator n=1 Tax=Actinacidiphila sp. ITFR-21 TaxID=3075199 RepID=UPI00288A9DFF|nr:helix-turn-helix domain-containing protein [Streptomyces sp. ITFR-21]WNI17988.1 helix-turn-helix domain-containing protein [Streptomyces sp. ITFR-21]
MMETRTRTRPTQRERSDGTIEALLSAARALFAAHGYNATSLDAVCGEAHVTKGALYHHFSGKQHLFRAVYEREQARLARVVARAYSDAEQPNSWEAVYVGARAFLAEALASDVQRIILLDAPGALGMDTMREISTDCLLMMREGIRRAVASGDILSQSVPALSSLLYGALCESAMAAARADDQRAALDASLLELRALFDALAAAAARA